MPKYYCDYCDVFLTHDSPSVRKSHNEGWKHKGAVRAYYGQFEENHTQNLIDQKIKAFEQQKKLAEAGGGGATFNTSFFPQSFTGAQPPNFTAPPPNFFPYQYQMPNEQQAQAQQ